MTSRLGLAAAALLPLTLLAACGSSGETTTTSGSTTTCEYVEAGSPAKEVDPPSDKAADSGTATATITTNHGDIGLTLDREGAPCTVNSFISLAEQGFYDDSPCPRLGASEGFAILQCGDPSGTMGGGPGYQYADELDGDETYPAGTIAMANSGADTNGSQFFLVFDDSGFKPDYTVFGTIDQAGLDVLAEIAAAGEDGSNPVGGGAPNKAVTIEKVTIS